MKKKNINIGDIVALICIISLIFLPFMSLQVKTTIKNMSILFLIAYLAYLFSHMPKGKTIYLIFPLILYSFIIFYVFRGASFFNNKEAIKDFFQILTDNFYILSLGLTFYLMERIFTRIFGSYFSLFLAIIALIVYLTINFSESLKNYQIYKEYFLYFSVFLVFSCLDLKKNIKLYFYIISIFLIFLELLLFLRKDLFLGFFLSPLFLLFLIFSKNKNFSKINFEKYFIFTIIFIFPMVNYLLDYFLVIRPFALNLASLIISFFLSVILYESKVKFLNHILLGIS